MDFSGVGVPNPVGDLVIDFPNCSINDIKYIIQVLYHGSSECHNDLNLSADEIIVRMNNVGYDLVNDEHAELVKLIRQIYCILCGIYPKDNPSEKTKIINRNFNEYVLKNSPVISPRNSPTVSPPKFMKKAKRN